MGVYNPWGSYLSDDIYVAIAGDEMGDITAQRTAASYSFGKREAQLSIPITGLAVLATLASTLLDGGSTAIPATIAVLGALGSADGMRRMHNSIQKAGGTDQVKAARQKLLGL